MKPLLTMDWVPLFNWTIQNIESTTSLTELSEKIKILTNFEKLFKTNRTIEEAGIKTQLKPGHSPVKPKTRPIPYHLQSYVEKIYKLIQSGHLQKIQKVEKDCFLSPVVVTVKTDRSAEVALDSVKKR